MFRARVIPVLLLRNGGLVKTVQFKNPKYVGDPINAVKIFNEKEVDELVFLDITATVEKRRPNLAVIRDIAGECFMPLAYGGGISSFDDAKAVFDCGVEKVVVNSAATDLKLLEQIAAAYGSQAVVVSIDAQKNFFGQWNVYSHGGTKSRGVRPADFARSVAEAGAGEIIVTSIEREGTYKGYDLDLVRAVSQSVTIPVVALGGAASASDLASVVREGGASAAAAGSIFVFHGKHRAVLINFPSPEELKALGI
jgi:cyclase